MSNHPSSDDISVEAIEALPIWSGALRVTRGFLQLLLEALNLNLHVLRPEQRQREILADQGAKDEVIFGTSWAKVVPEPKLHDHGVQALAEVEARKDKDKRVTNNSEETYDELYTRKLHFIDS